MTRNQHNLWPRLVWLACVALFSGITVTLALTLLPTQATAAWVAQEEKTLSAALSAEASSFTVTGMVTDMQTTKPVSDVKVLAFSSAFVTETLTNDQGEYTLTLPNGTYDFVFHPPLTSGLAFKSRRWIREAQTLNMPLPKGFLISGTVYSDLTKTNPVSNVNVFASNPDTSEGIGATPTLTDGTYALSLEPGPWQLTFTPPHFQSLGPTRTKVIIMDSNITRDIILRPGFTITGQVTANGTGVPGVEIFAQDFTKNEGGYGITATDANGHYTGTLPAGTFDILFFAPPFSGFGSTVVINVTGSPDTVENVTLPDGYTISGTVKCGAGLPNTFVHADPDTPSLSGQFGGWGRFTADDGYYALALQPSTYTLTADWPGGSSPDRRVETVVVNQDVILNFGACTVYLPIIIKPPDLSLIDDFDDGQDPNELGGDLGHGWPPSCDPTLDRGYDPANAYGGSAYGYRLTYTVTQQCYAVWETALLGYDYSKFSYLTFQIKGLNGKERPHIYLQDTSNCQVNPSCRHYVNADDYVSLHQLTTDWQQARIPLSIYKTAGVNLKSLQFFQVAFEWQTMNGTIYIDDIGFE